MGTVDGDPSGSVSTLASGWMTHVVVIESLEDDEPRTGKVLADFMTTLDERSERGVGVSYMTCGYRGEFLAQIAALTNAALNEGARPVLHIECHGDQVHGLEFANGSLLSWRELAEALVPLNRATDFNLLVVVSACYGGRLGGELVCGHPAPCLGLIGPSDEVSPSDIMSGFMRFYRSLFATLNASEAVGALRSSQAANTNWFVEHAGYWYEQVAVNYVQTYCDRATTREKALELRRRLLRQGRDVPMKVLKQLLTAASRDDLTGRYFDTYFMLDTLPANRPRFDSVRSRVESGLAVLRRTGRYAV